MRENPSRYSDLSLSAQTNFAELCEQAQARMMDRSVSDLPGSFATKMVKGRKFWYWQVRDLQGQNRQVFLGPDDERIKRLIEARKAGRASTGDKLNGLAGACSALGCMQILPAHMKVITRLSEHGFFAAGGVLIGTHAFLAMSNMLGVRWTQGDRTQDIDFAHSGKSLTLALPSNIKVDIHDAITSLELGLQPAKSITIDKAATYLNPKNPELRIDFLTTMTETDQPSFRFEPLGVNLQPLKFMEFSLEKPTQTAILSRENALTVRIPSPVRFALHKLIVMVERQEKFRLKIQKDAGQVASIVSFAMDHSPTALQAAADDIMARGKGWRSRVAAGTDQLGLYHPEIAARLRPVLGIGA